MSRSDLVELAKRRGYFFQSARAYGGVSGFYTYGPQGATLKDNVEDSWRERFGVREGHREIDAPTVLPEPVFEASGHLDTFDDMIVECPECGESHRGDHLVEDNTDIEEAESLPPTEIEELIGDTQAQTEGTVRAVRSAEENIAAGAEAVEDAADAFSQVSDNAKETDEGIREISRATDDQAASTEETVSMAEEVADISQSTADEADAVAEAADEQLTAMSEATTEAGSLAEQADRLQSLIRGFEVSGDRIDPEGPTGPNVAVGDGGQPE